MSVSGVRIRSGVTVPPVAAAVLNNCDTGRGGTYPVGMADQSGRRDPRGLRGRWLRFQRHWYADPGPALAPFVAGYWAVAWDYRGQPPYRQLVVPSPSVHLSFVESPAGADPTATVFGVARGQVERTLSGAGRVFGVAFRPGWFRPFLGRPVSTITDRSIGAGEVFGPGLPSRAIAEAPDPPEQARVVERFLLARLPPRDPVAEQVAAVVEQIAGQPGLTRVDQLADQLGTNVRRLQRRFAGYVGVGPKWVIRRCRLQEVTERMARGVAVDWARLAAELGYADQAHLTRDFTAMVGEPPTWYAQRYPAASQDRPAAV